MKIGGELHMDNMVNSNCKKCPDYISGKCNAFDVQCLCKFCPRDLGMCIRVKWCRETESSIYFED
jgi:hypothetical protein